LDPQPVAGRNAASPRTMRSDGRIVVNGHMGATPKSDIIEGGS
jgi:hypothetical protein